MNQAVDFSGVWIPIVTPFREHRVDHAALAALVRRQPLLLLLALPYARATFRTDQWQRRWVAEQNLALLAGDLVGLAALVRGSVRAGSVVL